MILSKCILIEKAILNSLLKIPRIAIGVHVDGKEYNAQPVHKIVLKTKPPFIMFASENRESIRVKNPDLPLMQLSKILGKMWRDLPEVERDRYKLQYKEQKKVNDAENKLHFEKLSKEEKQEFLAEQGKYKQKIRLRRIKALQKKFNMPKRSGLNPYNLFIKSKFLERGDAPFLDYSKGLRDFWIKMTDEDKKPFVSKARENAAKYKRQIAEWDNRMIATGHKSLIPKSRLSSHILNINSRPKRKAPAVSVKAKPIKASKVMIKKRLPDKKPVEQKPDENVDKKINENTTSKIAQKDELIKVLKSLEETIKEEFKDSETGKTKTKLQKDPKKN